MMDYCRRFIGCELWIEYLRQRNQDLWWDVISLLALL